MLRRTFLQSSGAALAASVPVLAAPVTGLRLGYDTYSLRAWRWKAMEHLEYAGKHKLDAIQLSGVGDFESLEPAYLAKVKQRAKELNIKLDGGTGCICPSSKAWSPKNGDPVEYLVQGMKVAQAIGSTSVRCFMGSIVDRLGSVPIEAHMENTIKVFKAARSRALDLGVKIALENHAGDMQAWETKVIIEESGKDYVAACLDAGNPIWVVEDPVVTMEVLGPYTVTTHIRDSVVYEHPRGAAGQWTAVGDGNIDLKHFIELQRKLCPQASVQLEIITGRPPQVLPYLEADFWKGFPKAKASEFARFVALAKRGKPFDGAMIIADVPGNKPAEYQAALKEQQKIDLERSLEYSKKTLGIGINWRS
jgi:sugar phosphate isomerase/epimerase